MARPIWAIGLMSGTSADGVDAALVEIKEGAKSLTVDTIAYLSLPFDEDERRQIFELFGAPSATVDKICRMNVVLGEKFATAALAVIKAAGLSPEDISLIGSHGQTIHHLPAEQATLQIGEAAVIAQRTGITTVSNFRSRDMAAGGEGAPLVPYFDWLMFMHPTRTRVLQNIGGIANMTVLTKGCGLEEVYAFDNGPGNMIIDHMVSHMTNGAMGYDKDGAIAARGQVNQDMLHELMGHEFILREPPKTSGREEFGVEFTRNLIQRWDQRGVSDEDMIATATAFTAKAISYHIKNIMPKDAETTVDELIVSGGGAFNPTLMKMLEDEIAPIPVVRTDHYGVAADAKEAIAFAVLAYQTVRGKATNVPTATGAKEQVLLGQITPGYLGMDLGREILT